MGAQSQPQPQMPTQPQAGTNRQPEGGNAVPSCVVSEYCC